MNNLEAYKDKLIEISLEDKCAVMRSTNELKPCSTIECSDCLFSEDWSCRANFIKWLNEEYKSIQEPMLTQDEHDACLLFESGYIARDFDGSLELYSMTPYRHENEGYWVALDSGVILKEHHFPFITWESCKSWSIEELLALKIKEGDEE